MIIPIRPHAPAHRKPKRRLFQVMLWSFAGLLSTLVALVAWLGYSENGARWLLARVSAMQPGLVEVDKLHGHLFGELSVRGLRLTGAGSSVTIDEINLRWSAAKLWSRLVYVDNLTVSGVRVLLPERATPETSTSTTPVNLPKWPENLPLKITVNDLSVHNVYVAYAVTESKALFEAHRLHIAGRLEQDGLHLDSLEVDAPVATIRAQVTVNPAAGYAVNLDAAVQGRLAHYLNHYPDVDTRIHLTGTIADLLVTVALHEPTGATLTGQITGLPDFSTAHWNARVALDDTSLQTWNMELPVIDLAGGIEAQGRAASQITMQPAMRVVFDKIEYHVNGNLNWNGDELQAKALTIDVPKSGTSLRAEGVMVPFVMPLTFDAALKWHRLSWPLVGPAQVASDTGHGRINGNLDAYTLAIEGDVSTNQIAPLRIVTHALGSKTGLKQIHAEARTADAHVQLDGEMSWTPEISMAGAMQWQQLQDILLNPPIAIEKVSVPLGYLHVAGTLDHYALALDTAVTSEQAGVAQITLGGTGSTQELKVARLNGAALASSLSGSGNLAWSPTLKWDMRLQGSGINVAQFGTLPQSALAFDLNTRGTQPLGKKGWVLQAEIPSLKGTFNALPVQARAGLVLDGDTLRLDDLRAALGSNKVSAAGTWGPKSDLIWHVDAPKLQQLDSRFQGAIRAEGKLSGVPKHLQATVDLDAQALRFGTFEIATTKFMADVNLNPQQAKASHIDVQLQGVSAGTERYETVTLKATGTAPAHEATLSLGGTQRSGSLTTHGGWDGKRWQGAIDNLILEPSAGQVWRSEGAVPLTLSEKNIQLDPLCIYFVKNRFCVKAARNEQGQYAHVDVPSLNLEVMQPWLPANLILRGALQAQANITTTADGNPVGYATITLPEGKMSRNADQLPASTIEFKRTEVDLRLNPDQFTLNIKSDVDKMGSVRGTVQAGGEAFAAQPANADLSGTLNVSVNDFSPLSPFIPKIKDIGGRANIDLTVAGRLSQPHFELNAVIEQGHVHITPANLRVGEIGLAITGNTDRGFEIRGDARSGDGALALRGYAHQDDAAGWILTSSLRGERVTAMDTRPIRVIINPDIDFYANPQGMLVRGSVHIPTATIRSPQIKDAKQRSRDVEILEEGPIKSRVLPLTLDLQITLGDQINVEANGLRAGLGGDVHLKKNPSEDISSSGELRIESGLFEAFGQALVIERGRLIFTGSSLTDPGLDLRATRKIDETTVGVQVSGRATVPIVTVFSDPVMNQSDALSFLLFGRALNGSAGDEAENSEGMSTAAAMGMEMAAQALGRRLGFEDIGIVQDEKGSTTVVIGRYVTPRLYVGYGAEILEQISSLHVNYKLSSKWTLQTETSAASTGADMVFTLDSE